MSDTLTLPAGATCATRSPFTRSPEALHAMFGVGPYPDLDLDLKATPNQVPGATPAGLSGVNASATFEELALPLLPGLYNHAFWLCRNHAEAEDLVQETSCKALRAFRSFEPGTNFKAWIFRILRNAFLTSRSGIAAARTVYVEDLPEVFEVADAGPTPEDTLIRLDNHAAIHHALDQLPPPLREVLLLCEVEKLKYKDIAVILDVPIGTVMSRLSRARAALRQLLAPHAGESL